MSVPDRRALVDRDQREPSIRRQCRLLGLARSGVYRKPPLAKDHDLALMRRIDELFAAWPFLGSRRMAAMLRAERHAINHKRMQRLMRRMRWSNGFGRTGVDLAAALAEPDLCKLLSRGSSRIEDELITLLKKTAVLAGFEVNEVLSPTRHFQETSEPRCLRRRDRTRAKEIARLKIAAV